MRRTDLEKENHHVVVIDVKCKTSFRIITLYRSFRPQGGISPETFFSAQLGLLKKAVTKNCLVLGNFNLDVRMELRNHYLYKVPFNLLTTFINKTNLVQLVNFETWTRTINGVRKESTLDHVYVINVTCAMKSSIKAGKNMAKGHEPMLYGAP